MLFGDLLLLGHYLSKFVLNIDDIKTHKLKWIFVTVWTGLGLAPSISVYI